MHKERLLKLANHLLTGELGHENFDFGQYNDSSNATCGTNGCAIGECPIVFPEDWIWDHNGCPELINTLYHFPVNDGCDFFEIDGNQYNDLFIPDHKLSDNSTKEEVAENIIRFVNGEELISNL